MSNKPKFVIITTVPQSLGFFNGQIQFLKKVFNVELISSPGNKFKAICSNEDVIGYSVPMKREISVLNDIISLYKLIKLFKILKPSVIHGSTPKAGLLSMIAARFTKVPVRIYYVHGLRYQGAKGLKKHLLIFMEKLSCFLASHIYVVSYGVKRVLKEDNITRKKIEIIGNGSVNGIDVDFFSNNNNDIINLKESYNLSFSNFVYGFVGRLVRDKGIEELVKAFLQINNLYPEARLLLVGNFENEDPIDLSIKDEIMNNPAILYVGFQKDVRPYLKMMNIFVFPSYREGFGVSLMEAASMGIPAISSNIIGCNEIIKNEYNGILFSPKSVSDLFRAMERVICDINLVNRMASVCRDYVQKKYDQKELWKKTLLSYSKIIENV